eukprot:178428_1
MGVSPEAKSKDSSKKDKDGAGGSKKEKSSESEPEVELDAETIVLNEIRRSIQKYEKGAQSKTQRLCSLAVRCIQLSRAKLSVVILTKIIDQFITIKTAKVQHDLLLAYLKDIKDPVPDVEMKAAEPEASAGEADGDSKKDNSEKKEKKKPKMKEKELKALEEARKSVSVETECYIHLVVLVFLSDLKLEDESIACARNLLGRISGANTRTLDMINSRTYFYFSLSYARTDRLAEIRSILIDAYRTCCLRHDEPGQAVLTNLILQNYLRYNLYTQADKFRLNSTFPEAHGGVYQHARYLYYVGRIHAVQLHYSEAFQCLSQAVRKSPQTAAVGFRQQATKLLVIVQLLLGEIPERSVFGQPDLRRSLEPYFLLTQAVRVGDVAQFTSVMNKMKQVFENDRTHTLLIRLRHNVLKTGLRNISLSYSRISLADIAAKLELDSVEDAEHIVAKAIHDGVISAVIDKAGGFIFSKENIDIYSKHEPQAQFHKRIKFCMDVHNESVKALRYPDKPVEEEETPADIDAEDIEILSDLSDTDSQGDVM